MLEYLLSSIGGLSKITTTGANMFNRKLQESVEVLYDSIWLLSEEVKTIREEVDYLLEVLDND
jgi:hypothetical protein